MSRSRGLACMQSNCQESLFLEKYDHERHNEMACSINRFFSYSIEAIDMYPGHPPPDRPACKGTSGTTNTTLLAAHLTLVSMLLCDS